MSFDRSVTYALPEETELFGELQSLQKYQSGSPKFRGASLAQGHTHFSFTGILRWDFANPRCMPNLKSLAPSLPNI